VGAGLVQPLARSSNWSPWRDLAGGAMLVLAATLYYALPSTAISLVCLLALAVLCWRRTDLAVCLIPLAVPFYMVPKVLHLGRHLEFSLGETVIVLCAAIVVVQQVRTLPARPRTESVPRHFLPASAFNLPAAVFLLAAALATLVARFHGVALREFRWEVLEPLLFFWLILLRVRGPVGATYLVLAVVAAGTVVALIGAYQVAFRHADLVVASHIGGGTQYFVSSVFQDENSLALLLDRAIPMALSLCLLPAWCLAFGQRWRENVRVAQTALLVATAIMLVILYKSGSRGGELTTVVCGGVLFALWQWRRPLVLAAGALVVAAGLFLFRHRLEDAASGGHGLSNLAHASIWESALRMLRDHPLFGVGPDNFLYYYSNDSACAPGHITNYYYVQAGTNFERCISHPHNMFLDFWLSAGVFGLLAWIWLLALFTVLGLHALRQAQPVWRGPLLAALMAMLALLVHGEVDNSYFLPDLSAIFWLCVGVVALWLREAAG
jgi:putative inorganic carbon (HCO3(-)) transporter